MQDPNKQIDTNQTVNPQTFTQPIRYSEMSQQPTVEQPKLKTGLAWKIYFVFLALMNLGTIFSILGLLWLESQAQRGESGTEFIALLLLPGLYNGVLVAVLNMTTIPFYIYKHERTKTAAALTTLIVLVSAVYFVWALPGFVRARHLKQDLQKQAQQYQTDGQARLQALQQATAPREISLDQAKAYLNACQIHQYYEMPNETFQKSGEDADKSSTGIYLVSLPDSGPWRIVASESIKAQLTPIAQSAKSKCGIPAINNDY